MKYLIKGKLTGRYHDPRPRYGGAHSTYRDEIIIYRLPVYTRELTKYRYGVLVYNVPHSIEYGNAPEIDKNFTSKAKALKWARDKSNKIGFPVYDIR